MIHYLFCSGLGLRRRRFLTFLEATRGIHISVVVMYYSRERKADLIKQWERYWALYCFMEQYMRQITMFWSAGILDAGWFDKVLMSWTECKTPSCSMLWPDKFQVLSKYLELVLYVQHLQSWIEYWELSCSALHNSCAPGDWILRNWTYRFSAMKDLWHELCKGANPVLKFVGWSGPRGFWVPPELCLYLHDPSTVAVEDPGFSKVMHLN